MSEPDHAWRGGYGPRTAPRWLSLAVGLGALLVFGGLVLYAYSDSFLGSSEDDVPLIAREPGPERVAPRDPGGEEIPHRNMEILNVQPGAAPPEPANERVLPPPERPLDPSTILAAAPQEQTVDETAAGEPGIEPEPDPGTEQVAGIPLPLPRPTFAARVPETPVATVVLPRPRPFAGRTGSGPGRAAGRNARPANAAGRNAAGKIQVGATRGRTDATIAWQELRARHPAELGGLTLALERTGGETGFWRILAGPVTMARARQICAILVSRGQTCVPVPP